MELPREPVNLPQARRYSRQFNAESGRAFQENNEITITIPRIDNTYLTKNVKLHFDFSLDYLEASSETLSFLYTDLRADGDTIPEGAYFADTFFGRHGSTILPANPAYVYTKPIPTFDINGAYGLIERIQVFSYLNNTLLEDIPNHNLLTAQFADFWFKDENLDINRPRGTFVFTEANNESLVRKQPCAQIYPPDSAISTTPLSINSINSGTNTVVPNTVSVTVHCALDLFSFLGRFSDKFVPLHNGFKIVLTVAKIADTIKFNTPFGKNQVFYRRFESGPVVPLFIGNASGTIDDSNNTIAFSTPGAPNVVQSFKIPTGTYASKSELFAKIESAITAPFSCYMAGSPEAVFIQADKDFAYMGPYSTVTCFTNTSFQTNIPSYVPPDATGVTNFDSSVVSASLANVYLETDLLEISPELDSKVDKMVYFQSWKYQRDFFNYTDFTKGLNVADIVREPYRKRILPDLKSITKIFVGQRPFTDSEPKSHQSLGFRIRNYTKGGRLFFNHAEVCKLENDAQAWSALRSSLAPYELDSYLNQTDFMVDDAEYFMGTHGQQTMIPSFEGLLIVDKIVNDIRYPNFLWFPGFSGTARDGVVWKPLTAFYQGRYLLAFDTRIPGATANSIAGIDSSKAVLEYQIDPMEDICYKSNIDVFIQHDAFIEVAPGKSTFVTF